MIIFIVAMLVNGKNNRLILRYFDNKQRPSVIFPIDLSDEDIKNIGRSGLEVIGNQVIVDVPENILRLSGLVRDAFEFCCNDENFKRKAKAEE